MKNIEYVTDEKGKKKRVLLPLADFEKLQGELEDLEDALELEKASREASGFKKWKNFIREMDAAKKA
jgi:PHD/YefM family antitoxin component YafN of YafNO toxin-antitoxin module